MIQKHKLKALMLIGLSASLSTVGAYAGGPTVWKGVEVPTSYLLFEAGASYSYALYKNSFTAPESHTIVTPNGVSIDPGDFYPNNFWGGYIGLSLLKCNMLYNIRYDMYAADTENGTNSRIKIAPVKLSFTADSVFGDINTFSYGLGAGVVISVINKGDAYTPAEVAEARVLDNEQVIHPVIGESIQGRTRIDPLVEVFGMYHITPNMNMKLNVAYQIPINNAFTNGSINANLGLNYALPV